MWIVELSKEIYESDDDGAIWERGEDVGFGLWEVWLFQWLDIWCLLLVEGKGKMNFLL